MPQELLFIYGSPPKEHRMISSHALGPVVLNISTVIIIQAKIQGK